MRDRTLSTKKWSSCPAEPAATPAANKPHASRTLGWQSDSQG
jgi:hypothetical protein